MKLFLIPFIIFFNHKIDLKLAQKLEKMKDDERIRVYIQLEEYDPYYVASLPDANQRVEYMKNHAYTTQQPVIEFLKSKLGEIEDLYQGWTANRIFAKLPKYIIFEITERFPEIIKIYEDEYKIYIPQDYTPHILSDFFPGEDYISGSILNIKADEGWRRRYKGKGIVIGNMDTGVDGAHPVLKNSFRGISAWRDVINNQANPYDDNGHGTGTMGFLVGSHGIGAAPSAKWIAVKILDNQGGGTNQQIQAGFDWVANLPDSLRPHLMSNSWGSDNTTDQTFWPNCRSWLLIGIIPVFAIGNAGPGGATAGTPGNFPMVFGIGGTYWPYEDIIYYSSRGPAPNLAPWTDTRWWPRPDWNRHKPDIIAPSEPTVTAAPGGKYQDFNGTSAATPHAAGALALLLQANNFGIIPSMATGDTAEIKRIYKHITGYNMGNNNSYWDPAWGDPVATPGLRDTFGWGRVDVEKWIANIQEPQNPHIFIDSLWVVSTNDGDKEIEPGESNVVIGIRLKNTGKDANDVRLKVVYRTHNAIIIPTTEYNFGNIPSGSSATLTNITFSTTDLLPQKTRVYFTARIRKGDNTYRKHDFFYLDTWKQNEPSQTKSLRNDNGTAAYNPGNDGQYTNYRYFASRFEMPNTGTMIACSIYTYNASNSAVNCTLFVWDHNSTYNAPGNLIGWRVISVPTIEQWNWFDITDITGLPAGYIWVGVRKNGTTNNGVPYQDSDGASTTNKSTNTRNTPSSWRLEDWWYDFMIRPRITTDPIVAPSIFHDGSVLFDDSKAGNDDGGADPGEQGGLAIALKNLGLNAYNVTGTLSAANQFTQNYVTIIKNTASFGNAPNGNPSTNNYNDPWIIRISDNCPVTGDTDFLFNVNISATYYPAGTGTPTNYTKTISFSLYSPFIVYENQVWYIPEGTGGLYYTTSVSSRNRYNYSDFYFGLTALDSFTVDTLYGYYYNSDATPDAQDIVRLYIHRHHPPNPNLPGSQIWTYNFGGGQGRGWKKRVVNLKVPGWIWNGIYTGGSAADNVYPVFFGAPLVGYYLYIYSSQPNGNPPNVASGSGIPYAFYVVSHHGHATISYYRPSTWSWPITPTNTRNSTTIPSLLNSWPDTTFANFAILNRSNINLPAPPSATARGPRDVWDNYLFLDNWSRWDAQVNIALNAWTYLTATNLWLKVPGGRHTLLIGLDWNNEVGGNVFNEYLRYWGQQFSWMPKDLYVSNAPKRIRWVPELSGLFSGPYYNATVYACSLYTSNLIPNYGKPWHGVAIRNFNLTWDNDLDLRLYSDKPTDPYTGYTNILESSELGPKMVDFIMIDGHHLGTRYYAGVFGFITPNNKPADSTWMHYEMARYVITTGTQWNFVDGNFTDSTIIHVFDVIINNGQTFQCSLKTLSGTQTFGIALYGSSSSDRIKRRIDYLAQGTGSPLYLSYTNSGANDTFGLVIWGNLNASGNYRLKLTGTTQSLGIMEAEFSAKSIKEGILLKWNGINGARKISIEKENKKNFERIAELSPYINEYIDKNVENGKTYTYRIIINYEESEKILGPVKVTYISPLPEELTILSMSKNMIKDKGFLKIAVPRYEKIDIEIYDPAGRICEKVFSGNLQAGIYEFKINKISKGVYFLILRDKEKRIREKIIFF